MECNFNIDLAAPKYMIGISSLGLKVTVCIYINTFQMILNYLS